jgi:hypothetical protein
MKYAWLVLALVGCAAPAVETTRDAAMDVAHYRTFAWIDGDAARRLRLDNPAGIDFVTGYTSIVRRPEIEPDLKASVERELHSRGFTENAEHPDFYVTFYGKAKDEDWVSTWSGRTPSIENVPLIMYPNLDRAAARAYREGSLLLVFYDPRTRKPAWTGSIANALSGKKVDLSTVTADLGSLVAEFRRTG